MNQLFGGGPSLDLRSLLHEAAVFAEAESEFDEVSLFGVNDGKTIGTYIEEKFRRALAMNYDFIQGNVASGVDFPELQVDIKTTSWKQPQSSSPFRSARQKIYGLGHALLVFVYEKTDDLTRRTGRLNIRHTIYVAPERTADFQMTTSILGILQNGGNVDDLVAYMMDKNLPVDDIQATRLAEEIIADPPQVGYLTISNALQWRLQYQRVIAEAGQVDGIERLR